MAGAAAGGFVSRAFESMLKECSGKKFTALQTAVQTYLGLYFLLFLVCLLLFSGNHEKSVLDDVM